MTNDQTIQQEVENYISSFLAQQFGESPHSVNVAMRAPFIAIHLLGLSIPSEKLLLKRNKAKRVTETRDIMINGIKSKLMEALTNITGFDVLEIYADWNLEKQSGMLIAVLDAEVDQVSLESPADVNVEALQEKIIVMSKKTQKEPDFIAVYWLNDDTILVERRGTMVDIEKELIKNGVTEELRLAKRPLEHRVMEFMQLEPIFNRDINGLFVDWNFEEDKAYMVFVLNPPVE